MTIIGQFRDLDRPDMFVWLRGFDGMDARKSALTAFYDGPVWAAWRDAANATMIDSDDVLLLKPAWPGADFNLSGLHRSALPDTEKSSDNGHWQVLLSSGFIICRPVQRPISQEPSKPQPFRCSRHSAQKCSAPSSPNTPKTAFPACR